MSTLQGKKPGNTYKQLLQIGASNIGLSASFQTVQDGEGNNSVLQLSTSGVKVNATTITINGFTLGASASGTALVSGGALGTPSSGTLTNCTGLVATTGLTATGTKDNTTFLRGDNTWAATSGARNDPSDAPLLDANGNELIKFIKVASAINEITVVNGFAGIGPRIVASGGDTNISLFISGKGSGNVQIGSDSGGYRVTLDTSAVTDNRTITYPDASGTFVLSGNALGTPSSGTLTNCTGLVATTGLTATGTKDNTTFLRGDNTWATAGARNDPSDVAIVDSNGNELIAFSKVTSAVNEITIQNAATGNAPQIRPTGGNTSIDLLLSTKGSGKLQYFPGDSGYAAVLALNSFTATRTFTFPDASGTFLLSGGAGGTPSSLTLTNATGLVATTGLTATGTKDNTTFLRGDNTWAVPSAGSVAVGDITGMGTGVATFLATPSSANLRSALTDETGSGALVFATSPTLVTPALGTPSSGTLTSCTGLPISTGLTDTAWTSFTPGFTGFSANPSTTGFTYKLIGKTCFVYMPFNVGTSNSTSFTITGLPATAVGSPWMPTMLVSNNSGNAQGIANINGTTATIYIWASLTSLSATGWTASNNKGIGGIFFYETT